MKNVLHPGGHLWLAPVAATKQDQAWPALALPQRFQPLSDLGVHLIPAEPAAFRQIPPTTSPTSSRAGRRSDHRISPETAPLKLPQSHGIAGSRGVERSVAMNPAIIGETHYGLTAATTIWGISTCSHPEETGRSGAVRSTRSCRSCAFGVQRGRMGDRPRPCARRRRGAKLMPRRFGERRRGRCASDLSGSA